MARPSADLAESAQPLLHERVRRHPADAIAAGRLRPGDRLPPERSLCEELEVSRATVRRALLSMVEEGTVESHQGRGWFVATGPLAPISFVSFSSMGLARGLKASAEVLRAEVRAATIDEAEDFGMAPGAPIFDLERLRRLDGELIAIDHSRVPLDRCPSLPEVDFSAASLYQVLEERSGIIPTRCAYVAEAAPADARSAKLLELKPGEPLLINEQMVYDQQDRVIERGHIAYRHDRFRFRAELNRA